MTPAGGHPLAAFAALLQERAGDVEDVARSELRAALDTAVVERLTPWPMATERLAVRLGAGDEPGVVTDDAGEIQAALERGAGASELVTAAQCFDRACRRLILEAGGAEAERSVTLAAFDALAERRIAALVRRCDRAAARRLVEAQERAAATREELRRVTHENDGLRRAERGGQHRADQLALVNAVVRRIAAILDPDDLLQVTAAEIQQRSGHPYVAVVILDHEGVLIGRWAGRDGVLRRSSGRAQGPAGGVIGRALTRRAPQVVPDVERDPDYFRDVPVTRSEMVVPLLEAGRVIGAMDFQSDRPDRFDLDDVAAAEALAEFLVVALRNARLFHDDRARGSSP